MDPIKQAFGKVKDDIAFLKNQIYELKNELSQIQSSLSYLTNNSNSFSKINKPNFSNIGFDKQTDTSTDISTHNSTQNIQNSTFRHINSTQYPVSTDNYSFKAPKSQNFNTSTRNQGVSTDRQTDRQTDTSTGNKGVLDKKSSHNVGNTSLVLNQLDSIKKDLRFKIKRLTSQEMVVFSFIYQHEDQGFVVDYSSVSQNLKISQSSIRDYVQRIINKGIPLSKEKINNKKVILHVPEELRRLASLDTLISLREI